MEFFYLCDLSLHSSSMAGDSLVASDRAGDVHVVMPTMSTFKSDHFKKDIKFYPADDLCFTTADMFRGIRVWDRARGQIVYSYREDSIRMHAYSRDGCLAAAAEGCVKFYDLRVRYHVGAVAAQCRKIEWSGDRIHCVASDSVSEYDMRNLGSGQSEQVRRLEIEGIQDFVSTEGGDFCIARRGETNYLLHVEGATTSEMESTRRVCVGDRMVKARDSRDFSVGVLDGNSIGFYEYRDTWACVLGQFRKIDEMWFGRENVYAFADRKIHFMEGGYSRLRELGCQ